MTKMALKARIVGRPWPVVVLLVIWLHWWAIDGLHLPGAPDVRRPFAAAMTMRPVALPPTVPAPIAKVLPSTVAQASQRRPALEADPVSESRPLPSTAPPPLSGDIDVPVYATQLPPSLTWRYAIDQGHGVGAAELRWQRHDDPDGAYVGDPYEAHLVAEVNGSPAFDWQSRGRIDGAGVAPERFVDSRRGRSGQAANFQRDLQRVTYSGHVEELPLPAGAQDRLSWLPQLAGIVAAEPARWVPGSAVVMYVSGAHADAQVWRLVVQGMDRLADGTLALKLTRDPGWLYDLKVEVWLDPARHDMPVQLHMTNCASLLDLKLMEVD